MNAVTIYLGSKCNMNCPYCHRQAAPDEEKGLPEAFYTKLKAMAKDGPLTVKFMGGEPTLYMDTIKKVVSTVPTAHFAIATNGVKLKEYLPFFREHDFLLCLSYDGDESDLRGFDPLTDVLDYKHLAISTTIYHGNTDFKAILKRFRDKAKILGRRISFFPHIVHYTSPSNEAYRLNLEDYKAILEQWKSLVMDLLTEYKQTGNVNGDLVGLFIGLFGRLKAGYEFGETYCVNKHLMKVGPTGQPISCQYIRDVPLSWNNWQEEQAAMLRKVSPRCEICSVYDMCGGGCHKSLDAGRECMFYHELYSWFKKLAAEDSAVWRLGDELR